MSLKNILHFLRRAPTEQTIVCIRTRVSPAELYEAIVHYDHWGSPYILHPNKGYRYVIRLHETGRTNETWFDGTEWKHKTGPAVTFGKAPADMFADLAS
ncbi:hypothetical protein LAV_00187 [Sphingobium phage Lacusarx]|uniref:Uncharacterized protein n=1 Tax=Sphingobium phage Lacusarx TaxID=1980139 RepID=A0A1W6DXR4_9CAUD|nr:hypothetical protein FDH44_gp116 [Sphingobium phage Lacusarx]ARK07562.1 hypothetical protein LAV_00187 [Sphingobium phage Lacusarx]